MLNRAAACVVSLVAVTVPGCAADAPGYDTNARVAAAVTHFAPGLGLGGNIERNSALLPSRRWVAHVGAIGQAPTPPFVQVRLYPDAEVRARADIDGTAPLRSMEWVSVVPRERERVMSELSIALGAAPREGCIFPVGKAEPLRSVHYWAADGGDGGLAVVSDWTNQPSETVDDSLWSLWAWSGPLSGGETLLAPFSPEPCDSNRRSPTRPSIERTSAALQTLDRAFRDSVRASRSLPDGKR